MKKIHIILIPIHHAATQLHVLKIVRSKKAGKMVVGLIFMLTGSALSYVHIGFLPHFVWHTITGSIHAYGVLPVLRVLNSKLDLEHLD